MNAKAKNEFQNCDNLITQIDKSIRNSKILSGHSCLVMKFKVHYLFSFNSPLHSNLVAYSTEHVLRTHPCNENRVFPVRKTSQGKPCFHYRDGFAMCQSQSISLRYSNIWYYVRHIYLHLGKF